MQPCISLLECSIFVIFTAAMLITQEEFLKDVMQFLILRGHTRLIPQGGIAEFPDAILNAKRLDLFNLYREVSYSVFFFFAALASSNTYFEIFNWLCCFFLIFMSSLSHDVVKTEKATYSWKCCRWFQGVAFMLAMA